MAWHDFCPFLMSQSNFLVYFSHFLESQALKSRHATNISFELRSDTILFQSSMNREKS